MNSTRLLLTIAAASTLCASTALASDIYRYDDENGNAIYVDRPTGKPGETRLNISSRNTDYAAVQARQGAATGNTERTAEQADEELTSGDKRAAADLIQKQCEVYREQLGIYLNSRRLYREDANGERVYLNDDELQDARDEVQQLIEENCG